MPSLTVVVFTISRKVEKILGSNFLRKINSFLGLQIWYNLVYRIVVSASSSHFEAHTGHFRLLMKGIFDPYVL